MTPTRTHIGGIELIVAVSRVHIRIYTSIFKVIGFPPSAVLY